MPQQMLINYVPGEECRIAIVEDGKLEEFYQERASVDNLVGNIYKGRVTNVEPAIQAAFIDFGSERNGFLHITDLHPRYFPGEDKEDVEKVGLKTPRRERPPIQQCLKRGQEVLVQVIKEGINTKGPTLTSYLSIPGRFIVMMPHMERLGVTRKVEDDDERREMKKILQDLKPPDGFGFIVRTAGMGQTKTELKRDLAYLTRLWKQIEQRRKKTRKTGELYAEADLMIRTVRDVFSNQIERVVCDDPGAAQRCADFLRIANPRSAPKVVCYQDPVPIFDRFGVESQIDLIYAREVPLPSGGSLVFDQAEALVAIDVNSGKSRSAKDAETNAYKTNLEAVDEIARQLKLRDLGGVVINDLIDMSDRKHRAKVEQRFRAQLKKDRARTRTGAISQFGILEMTRQRMRPSLKKTIFDTCPTCAGSGYVKSPESTVFEVIRRLALVMNAPKVARIELTISGDVAFQLLNRRRAQLVGLESQFGKQVMVRVGGTVDNLVIDAFDERGARVNTDKLISTAYNKKAAEKALIELDDERFTTLLAAQPTETDNALEELAEAVASVPDEEDDETPASTAEATGDTDESSEADDEQPTKKKRRRRRRGGRKHKKTSDEAATGDNASDSSTEDADKGEATAEQDDVSDDTKAEEEGEATGEKKKRRRKRGGRRRKKKSSGTNENGQAESGEPDDKQQESSPEPVAEVNGNTLDGVPVPVSAGSTNGEAPTPRKTRKTNRSSKKRLSKKKPAAEASDKADSTTATAEPPASSGYSNSIVAEDQG